mgnify:CR=1 FL=1
MKILHNPRCSKSRQTLALIEQAGVEPDILLYLETPPTADEMEEILGKLEMEPADLFRRGEDIYGELGLAGRELSRQEAIDLLVNHPQLIERPIVIAGERAVLVLRDLTEARALTLETRARLEEAEARLKGRTAFFASLGHDLKTPLNAILGYADMMRAGIRGPIGHPPRCGPQCP